MSSALVLRRTSCQMKTLKLTSINLRLVIHDRLQAGSLGCTTLPLARACSITTTRDELGETLTDHKQGRFDKLLVDPDRMTHFKKDEVMSYPHIGATALPHPIWSEPELHNVEITHTPADGFVDRAAYFSVKMLRSVFDVVSGFNWGTRTEIKWLRRITFLEAVAGVPGMVAAMTRHLHSLRRLRRDYGWIHTLLEEAENERMHLMIALQVRKPCWMIRLGVIPTQGFFVTMFSLAYLISPRFCHRFVGYLEEEAVITYTKCLQDIETGSMTHWKTEPAPVVAKDYWLMEENATMKDVILAIRADEAHHRQVNHTLASMKETDYNPYEPGK